MAQIIDSNDASRSNGKSYIGIVELKADINRMIRSEKIINIASGLDKRGWEVYQHEDLGRDAHVFYFQLRNANTVTYPEKCTDDWRELIKPYKSLAIGADYEIDISEYE